ncbi:MAG: InlB B-repeat-containing protein, partial [Saprospiraceae bacterium]|nr:InlB B-repeat-containing protein [Saprospiraceae bacterium]
WGQDGTKIWSWDHDLANNVSTWTHWWTNEKKRLESQWNTNPVARDLPTRHFRGLVSNGTARHWNISGQLVGTYTFLSGVRIVPRGNYTENFSTDPSGRGWAGSNNTTDGNDIKWSSSTKSIWCSPETPGAISAVFARSSAYRYYADTSIGAKNRTQTLHISGNWIIKDANYLGTFRIGYFNKANPGSNFIGLEFREPGGVRIDPTVDNSGKEFRAFLSVKGAGGTTSTVPIEPHLGGTSFDLIWKGNPDGSGTLSGTLTGRPISIKVDAGSGSFDSFGILSGGDSSSDSTKKTDVCYFDNLTYDKGEVKTYTVNYNANGGAGGVPSAQTKPKGVDLPLSTCGDLVKKGYTFAGWNTAADGTGTSYAPGALYSINTNVTLYARWKRK